MRSLAMKPNEDVFRVVATDEYGRALYSFPLVCFARPKILFKDGEKPIPRFCARSCHLCSSQWIEGRWWIYCKDAAPNHTEYLGVSAKGMVIGFD